MPAVYRIQVAGELDEKWSVWLGGMAITYETASNGAPITLLTSCLDAAALRGTLTKILDLNLTLLSVTRVPPEATVES